MELLVRHAILPVQHVTEQSLGNVIHALMTQRIPLLVSNMTIR